MGVGARQGAGAIAGTLVLIAVYMAREASRMPRGTLGTPGPGFFPFGVAIALGITGMSLLAWLFLQPTAETGKVRLGNRHIAVAVLAQAVAALSLERFGFLISMSLFLVLMLGALARLGWIRTMVAAVMAAALALVFFQKLLGFPLPGGPR